MKRFLGVLIASFFLASAAYAADGDTKGKGEEKKAEAKTKGKGEEKKAEAKTKGEKKGDTKGKSEEKPAK